MRTYCEPLNDFTPGPGRYSFHGGDGAGHVYPETLCTIQASSYARACKRAKALYSGYPVLHVKKHTLSRRSR